MLFVWAPQRMPEHENLDFGFGAFWLRYPNRTAKKDAERAWKKLNPSEALQTQMFAAIESQKAWRALGQLQREWRPDWPYPATWLRGERWEDELPGLTGQLTVNVPCRWCGNPEPHGKVECNARWLEQERARKARASAETA
jgi:hypothetical protein